MKMTPQRKQQHRRCAIPSLAGVASIALAGMSCAANAQQKGPVYPDRPVRMLVGFAPGGGADTAARPVAQRLSEVLGQQFVVDNRPGAGGNIATEIAARATPDGYSLLVGTIAALAINPSIYEKLAFDPIRDFSPITNMASSINVLVVHPSVAAKTVKELVALLRAKPGSLNYGSSGVGSAGHLSGVLLEHMTRTDITHVPYKGGAPAMGALLGGEVQMVFATAATAIPQIKAGKVRGLAVTTATRAGMLPDLPTIAEAALPGYEANNWYGLLAPAKTPKAIIDRLNAETVKILGSQSVREIYFTQGLEPTPTTPEAFGAYIKSEIAKWSKLVKAAGVKPD
jgi:tripartite-type tricarboxylate transporter receptor subunit TctC